MAGEGLPKPVIDSFRKYFDQLLRGRRGMIPESEITPLRDRDLVDLETLPPAPGDEAKLLKATVVLRLNGGLGTSMGLKGPKGILKVKQDRSFLDIVAEQVKDLNRRGGVITPLVLMNSFSTHRETMAALRRISDPQTLRVETFLQHKFPKILRDTLAPAQWPADPTLEWNPPGHGELYVALQTSGMLDRLLADGSRYAFISNIDNLGALPDMRIPAYLARTGTPFLMEVAARTEMDRKGGHLATSREGGLVLRESSQTPDADKGMLGDITTHRYFNTNSIWIDLKQLSEKLASRDGSLPLPMICNPKTLDPRDPDSPPVFQLESAMGAAIALFKGAGAIRVPRTRFFPVKDCGDLLLTRSDSVRLEAGGRLSPAPRRRTDNPLVELDKKFYRTIDQLESRFPHGSPSLAECESLRVEGDVTFGANVVIRGRTRIMAPRAAAARVPDGMEIEGDYTPV